MSSTINRPSCVWRRCDVAAREGDLLCDQHELEARLLTAGHRGDVAEAAATGAAFPVKVSGIARQNFDGTPCAPTRVEARVTVTFSLDPTWRGDGHGVSDPREGEVTVEDVAIDWAGTGGDTEREARS